MGHRKGIRVWEDVWDRVREGADRAATIRQLLVTISKVDLIVFDEQRPVRQESVLETTTDRPTASGRIGLSDIRYSRIDV